MAESKKKQKRARKANFSGDEVDKLVGLVERPRSYPTFMPPRPLEGRISRLIGPNQCVRCVMKDGRIQYVPFSPQIDIEMEKVPEYKSLPTETHESFQDPSLVEQWKKLQSAQHPDTQLRMVEESKQHLKQEGPENPPFKFSEEKEEEEGNYLKQMAERRKEELETLTENTRWKQAQLQQHHHDLRLLKRNVDYTSPPLQSPVYYDTLHKIYSNKPPFYYDGNNPYEYDFVLPWDYHKTETLTDAYKLEAARDELAKSRCVTGGTPVTDVQFAGSPGRNPYIMPKYTQQQLLHGMPRLEASIAQKPVAQSTNTHSYCPNQVKTVVTPDNDRFNLRDMSKSLPNMYSSRSPPKTSEDHHLRKVHFNQTGKIATGGGDLPLVNRDYKSCENLSVSKSFNFPAYENPGSSPKVDGRHFNPEGARDPRLDWKPSSPFGPRPQTKLLNMQDSFTRTDARRKFQNTFTENNPDLRDNTFTGKKHEFGGIHAYLWH